jgi:hypothetical protein
LESVDDLSSCKELIPGYFNLHWQIDNTAFLLGLEGRPGNADNWLGFGFSPPAATGTEMVGSNVIVAGMVKGKCFAYPYFLSSQSQCDFVAADGVCPDFAGKKPLVPSTSINVLSCEKEGDKLSIMMTLPLDISGGKSAWPVDGSRYSIYAMGPVSEGSNSTVPVVLYHSLKLPGTSAVASITTSRDTPLKINLSSTQKNCRTIVPNTSTPSSNAPNPSTSLVAGSVATIDGPTTFNVTLGSNKLYPNPPAWGYSLWVNKKESPVLVVRRGTMYTFNVAAGPTHPVYITSSIIGGGLLVDYEDETVFAGNDTTFGTPGKAVGFTWTPDETTPDLVYYQCVVHQKLGWEIKVMDAGSPSDIALTPAPAPVGESSSMANINCKITTGSKSSLYNACILLDGVGENFNMAWNLDPSAAESSYELSMGFNATSNGWVSIAFPKTAGQMIGSFAMILKTCASCPSGAEISEYSLEGQTVNGVKSGNTLNSTDLEAAFNGGELSGKFKIRVPMGNAGSQPGRRRSLFALDSAPSNFPLIFAAGDLSSSGNLQQHSTFGSSSLDISIALVSKANITDSSGLSAPVVVGSTNSAARTAHMWLMTIGFGVLIPIGILIKSCFKSGFNLHRAIQTIGFLLGVAGIICGFIAGGGWSSQHAVHRNIGMAIIVLCSLQVFALVWRPKLDANSRRPWAFAHRWLGRIVAVLAISNIYYGMIYVAVLGTWAWATYTAIVGVILMVALGKEIIIHARGKVESQIENEKSIKSFSTCSSSQKIVHEV